MTDKNKNFFKNKLVFMTKVSTYCQLYYVLDCSRYYKIFILNCDRKHIFVWLHNFNRLYSIC